MGQFCGSKPFEQELSEVLDAMENDEAVEELFKQDPLQEGLACSICFGTCQLRRVDFGLKTIENH